VSAAGSASDPVCEYLLASVYSAGSTNSIVMALTIDSVGCIIRKDYNDEFVLIFQACRCSCKDQPSYIGAVENGGSMAALFRPHVVGKGLTGNICAPFAYIL